MKKHIFTTLMLSLIVLSIYCVKTNAQSAGSLDTAFGSGGIVLTQLNQTPPAPTLQDMIIQPDGKVIVSGTPNGTIARFNLNGTLDTAFDGDGVLNNLSCKPNSVKLQSDGKIVYGGFISVSSTVHFCVGRLNSNGSQDTGFSGGLVQTTIGIESQISSINLLPNGKILAAGWTSLVTALNRDYALAQYNSDGSIDTTFGTGGRVSTELGSNEFAYGLTTQPDGKIIVVGNFTDRLAGQPMVAIVRYNTNGSLDTNFGTDGKFFKQSLANGKAVQAAVETDGKIIVVGYGFIPFRLTPTGTVAAEFITPLWTYASSVAIQPDGKILIGGRISSNTTATLVRYNADNTRDPFFAVTNTGGMSDEFLMPTKLAIAPDGKIVFGGSSSSNGFTIILARYTGISSVLPNKPYIDFDGDGKTDVSIFRPSLGQWWFARSSDGANRAFQFGTSTDKIVPGDYTGDRITDIAVFRPSTNGWYVLRSENSTYYNFPFGAMGDVSVPGDYDGDGSTDPAVFRPSTSTWYIARSCCGGVTIRQFGTNSDVPAVADYDGDGKTDIGIYRVALGQWWYLRSSDGTNRAFTFGTSTDKPMQGDYTGDGKADLAIFRPSTGQWFILRSEDATFYGFPFGTTGDIPASGDYDGDGRFDSAVFRPSNATWYLNRSTAGTQIVGFGASGDIPVPSALVP